MQATSACGDCVVTFLLDEGLARRAGTGRRRDRPRPRAGARGAAVRPSGHGARACGTSPAERCRSYAGAMVRPVADLPTWDEVVAIADGHSITRLGVAPADVLDRARAEIVRRKAAGLHAGMGFTYRNPDAVDRPATGGARARSRSSPPPGRTACATSPSDRRRCAGAGRPLRVGRPLRPAPRRPARDRAAHPARRREGGRVRRRQLDRRPRGRLPRRARLVRQERQRAAPRCRQLLRARVRRHDRRVPARRAGAPTAAARAGAASTAVRPGRSSRPASSTPTAAWRGSCSNRDRSRSSSARRSATDCTGATTARRCARRRSGSARATASTRRPTASSRRRGSTCSTCSMPPTSS